MSWRYKIYVMYAAFLQRNKSVYKLVLRIFASNSFSLTYILVLTKNAAEITARKKYGSRAVFIAYRRFFIKVRSDTRYAHSLTFLAKSLILRAVDIVFSWTCVASAHKNSPLICLSELYFISIWLFICDEIVNFIKKSKISVTLVIFMI